MWPSIVTHALNLCSAFNPSKCTHTAVSSEQTQTHTRSSRQPFMLQRSGSSWVFGAMLKVLTSVVVLRVERERWTFTPPTYNPCRTWDSNLWVTSPTLYPLGHDCPWAGGFRRVLLRIREIGANRQSYLKSLRLKSDESWTQRDWAMICLG